MSALTTDKLDISLAAETDWLSDVEGVVDPPADVAVTTNLYRLSTFGYTSDLLSWS